MRENIGILKKKYTMRERIALNKIYSVLIGHKQRKLARRFKLERIEELKQKQRQLLEKKDTIKLITKSSKLNTVQSQMGEKCANEKP